MNEIEKLIEELTEKYLIDKISRSLLEPEFNQNNSIIPKALKYVVKNIPIIIKHANLDKDTYR